MKHTLLFCLFHFLIHFGLAQEKYLDNIYQSIRQETITYFSKPDHDLLVDIYTADDDVSENKPLLLYVHGGGFRGGSRNNEKANTFCLEMAKKGYVSASIDYTLVMKGQSFSCDQLASVKVETFRKVGNDISHAVRFFSQNKARWKIDTTKIVILGSSAGAEAVLHAAFWNKARQDTTQIIPPQFQYAGVVSMAGALVSLDMITEKSAIPVQLFHGTCDNLVPYTAASHHYCEMGEPGYLMLNGSYAIAEKIKSLGKPFYLFTDCGGGHEWASKPLLDRRNLITDFLYYDVLKNRKRQIHLIEEVGNQQCQDYPSVPICN